MQITRRAALRGTAAMATCAVALPVLAAAETEDPALQAAAEWHERWSRMQDFERYLEKHPEVYDDNALWYASAGPKVDQEYSHARRRIVALEPTTVAGAA